MSDVIRSSETQCSYLCPYYLDGAVASYCNKYEKYLNYDGTIPPLLTHECKKEAENVRVSDS